MNQFGATIISAAENILGQDSRHTCAHMPPGYEWGSIAESQHVLMSVLCKKIAKLFPKEVVTISIPTHQSMGIPFAPQPCQT